MVEEALTSFTSVKTPGQRCKKYCITSKSLKTFEIHKMNLKQNLQNVLKISKF